MLDDISPGPAKFNFMAPPTTMLYLTQDLQLRGDVLWDDALVRRIGGMDSLKTFAGHLRTFRKASAFDRFFSEHASTYEQLVARVLPRLGARDHVHELEAFYGTRQSSYNLLLVSLYGPVGFGPHLDLATGERHVYNILGPLKLEAGRPAFGDESYFTMMQRHEFSHPVVNPLTDKHWDRVKQYAYLFDTLPEQTVCGEWNECVSEYVIRAVTTYLAFQDSQAAGQAALEAEKARNVVLIDDLLDSVRQYAQNRDRYPTMDDYYPQLLEVFAGYAQDHKQ
jgi:hypothetical protein